MVALFVLLPFLAAPPVAVATAVPATTPAPVPAVTTMQLQAAPDAPKTEDAPEVDGRRLLLKCEKQFLKLTSLKGTIRERVVHHELGERKGKLDQGEVLETESDFSYKRYDSVRFENVLPVPHSVIWNGSTLWIWSPQENAAIEEAAANVPMLARAALSVQPGYGIDLLAAIPLDEYKPDVKRIVGSATKELVVTLTPVDSKTLRATMQLVVDPEKLVVTRILTLAGEGTLMDVQLTNLVEAGPGIWFPTRTHTRAMLGDGSIVERLRTYERVKFNTAIDDSRFSFKIPDGATVVPLAKFTGTGEAAGEAEKKKP